MISLRTASLIRLGLALTVAASVTAGCIFDPKKDDGDGGNDNPGYSRHTADSLLKYFAYVQADPQRDLTEYGRCLHTNYTFWFTAQDRAGDPTIPEFWTKESDVAGTERMFDNAIQINMNLTVDDTLGTEPCDPAHPEVLCTQYEVRVVLSVEVPPAQGQTETTTYVVQGLSNISITEDPLDTDGATNGQDLVIYQIVDRTNELGRSAPLPTGLAALRTAPADGPGTSLSWGELRHRLAP